MRQFPGLLLGLTFASGACAQDQPGRPAIDAPELAALGPHPVGVGSLTLEPDSVVDVLAFDPATGPAPPDPRMLVVEIWYPAAAGSCTKQHTHVGEFPAEPPAPPKYFIIQSLACGNAKAADGRFPLVIVSHGYSNDPFALAWLTENLASKGYVVAAIRHGDPLITDRTGFPVLLYRRPIDIEFVARTLQDRLAEEGRIDPARTALVGYSMGGYGVLTAAGGELDPDGGPVQLVPGGLLKPYARGGSKREAVRVAGVKAVVALAPAGGSLNAWGADGLRGITAPLLLISGDRDWSVDYTTGARAIFDMATNSNRYLLTFRGAGHHIGLGPAPFDMRSSLWDFDWFEDPVWRADRIVGINLHFITAFLDRYVKDDASRTGYLDGLVPDSTQGEWPAAAAGKYGSYSPGADGITVWKGFQRQHAEGLELVHAEPRQPASPD
jgi:predicted dienelactone hydrolase